MRAFVPWFTQSFPRLDHEAPVSPRRLESVPRWRSPALIRRATDRDNLPLVALAMVVVGISLLLGRIAVTNHNVFTDEANAVFFGRSIADDLSLAWSESLARGPERLTSLVTALIATVTDSASRQLWLLHAFMALCQGLVAVPAWLAGRQLGLGRWAAVVAAAIAASGSFATYGIYTLNQSIGLLCATILLWAMVRAMRRPGLAPDLVVVAALAATVLARVGWAPLVVALVPGVLGAAWFDRPVGERLGAWLRALPARLARRHPVLLPLFALGILAAVAFGPSALLGGGYGGVRLEPDIELATLWDNARVVFSHLAIGLALVPFILAIPLLVRDLAKPVNAISGGYAWLVLGLLVIFFYTYYSSVDEDRYFAVLVPPFAIAGTLAVFQRPPPVWGVLVSGLLTARLVVTTYSWPEQSPFDYFLAPTSLFFQRVVLGELSVRLPFSTPHVATLAALGAAAAALVIATLARVPGSRRPLGLVAGATLLAGVLAFQVAATEYPSRKFVEAVGTPDVPEDARSFIDRAAGDGHAEPLAVDDAVDPDLNAQLPFLRVYNHTLGAGMAVIRRPLPSGAPVPRLPTVRVDWRTGDAEVEGAVPDILLEKPGFYPVGFSGRLLPPSAHYPFAQLRRLRHPLTPLWVVRGDGVQGFPERRRPLRLRVFPPTARSTCVRAAVAVPTLADRASRYRVTGASRTLRGVADYGAPGEFVARVRGGRPTTLALRGSAVRLPDGSWVGPTFANLNVAPCE